MSRIAQAFSGGKAFIPFITCGDPDLETTAAAVRAAAENGADLIELGIPFTDPEGTYFVLADIAPYMKKGQSDVEFCVEMAQKVGVACVPASSFFDEDVNHIVRLHFAKKDETLLSALDRLSRLKQIMCG